MTLSNHKFRSSIQAVAVLALALSLGACSRAQRVTEPVSGIARDGAGTQVVAGCPTLVGNTLNTADAFTVEAGMIAGATTRRIRIETTGDIASPTIASMGACAAADIPSINFVGGHANVFVSGTTQSVTTSGGPMTFGALLFPGTLLEPGVVVANDAQGNVLEIIWPEMAGVGIGSPIVRVQLAAWNTALVTPATKLDVTWDMEVQQDGVSQFVKGHCEGMSLDGTPVVPGGAAVTPCPATLGAGGNVNSVLASIVQFRSKRLRFEANGDVLEGTINAAGACAAAEVPTINFTGGSANVFQAGTTTSVTSTGGALTFGALLFPGILLEPGVVVANDANKNVLEIIWPGLAGLPPGAPILRLQLAKWNSWVRTGRALDFRMRFDAVGPDGLPASFFVNVNNVAIPQQR
ncbi:MAG: hypothetical protein ABL977_10090 [Candidatus Eisenbacteria bacterium]